MALPVELLPQWRTELAVTEVFERQFREFERIAPDNHVSALHFHDSPRISIAWQGMIPRWSARRDQATYVDCNIIGDTFYLLGIGLAVEWRGKGIGALLYRTVEECARELKCDRIYQTPSGWTTTGETRLSYLIRRGWIAADNFREVYKDFMS